MRSDRWSPLGCANCALASSASLRWLLGRRYGFGTESMAAIDKISLEHLNSGETMSILAS